MEVTTAFEWLFCSVLVNVIHGSALSIKEEYMQARAALIYEDASHRTGAFEKLSEEEHMVNNFLLREKRKVMDESRKHGKEYLPAASFYRSKSVTRTSEVYNLIRQMPKGGVLHIHDSGMPSLNWTVKNASYWPHTWMCFDENNLVHLRRSTTIPTREECQVWSNVDDHRRTYTSNDEFNKWLMKNISFLAVDPVDHYRTGSDAWKRFQTYFSQVGGILKNVPIYEAFYRQALEQLYADGVQYLEVRSTLSGLVELDGTKHDAEHRLKTINKIVEQFKKEYPDFIGAKVIQTGLRFKDKEKIQKQVEAAIDLHKRYPDTFVGYDLVAEEDPYQPLQYYIDALLYPAQQNPPYHLPYFFHAAETNWQETQVDYNLVDAILLNATRIGHGFGLTKHPRLMEIVKEKGIGIEVNPISNQLLGYVKDIRNHPMVSLLADDYPIVISSDDPNPWESSPLTDDFYVAFMAMSGRDTGLAFLKKLALNSITYSGMTKKEKVKAKKMWQLKWDLFIKNAPKIKGDSFDFTSTTGPPPDECHNDASTQVYSGSVLALTLAVLPTSILLSIGY